ncbi:MAG TPA: hypothetical protein VNA19_16230 [Pyrinomonadaceae bacterium]|nr:hypothetical protein [Pyrinomonadaceae bacterium]
MHRSHGGILAQIAAEAQHYCPRERSPVACGDECDRTPQTRPPVSLNYPPRLCST